MSLTKQLWLAIIVVLSLAISGAFVVSTITAQRYFQQQLHVKNIDNATALALSMSQMPKDPVTVELLLAAQFDAGHYKLIRLADPAGKIIVERRNDDVATAAPNWFIRLVPLAADPGVAQVQDGWRQFGTLTLESDSRYAYVELWAGTRRLLLWLLMAAITIGLAGTLILSYILRPLDNVVAQAKAIGGRRFITTDEPRTLEFRTLVREMNRLSGRVRDMVEAESRRVDELRRQTQIDPVSGLYNRETFFKLLDATLGKEDLTSFGSLVILRVADLDKLNRTLGRDATDALLRRVGERLHQLADRHSGWNAGRLNGADFAVLASGASDVQGTARELETAARAASDIDELREESCLPVGAVEFRSGEPRSQLMSRLDGALAASEESGEIGLGISAEDESGLPTDLAGWRTVLEEALRRQDLQLGDFPVLGADGEILHFEAPVRLHIQDEWRPAGVFISWAARLGLMTELDLLVVQLALVQIRTHGRPIAVNLSPDSVASGDFHDALIALLASSPDAARQLWIETPEYGALKHKGDFRALCLALKRFRCHLGLKHAGPHFSRIGELHDVGLDHIKIDASVVHDIHEHAGNQAFLRGLCMVAHAIGLKTIAEGVRNAEEMDALPALGIDGMTGPGVQLREG